MRWGARVLKFVRLGATALTVASVCGRGLPSFTLYSDRSLQVAPAGPSVAALIANVKCELWEAANDTTQLPYYEDTPAMKEEHFADDSDRNFTLKILFEEIEHVAELKLTGAVNPSANSITPYSNANTNMTLAVCGQLAESADRILDILQSIDFQRLVASPEESSVCPGHYGWRLQIHLQRERGATSPPPSCHVGRNRRTCWDPGAERDPGRRGNRLKDARRRGSHQQHDGPNWCSLWHGLRSACADYRLQQLLFRSGGYANRLYDQRQH